MTIRKIGGPGIPEMTGTGGPEAAEPSGKAREAFGEALRPERGAGASAAPGLEGVLVETVQAVRRGDLDPDLALDAILAGSREILAAQLPPEVDMKDVLEYIRETLEADPTFMALVKGTVPSGA